MASALVRTRLGQSTAAQLWFSLFLVFFLVLIFSGHLKKATPEFSLDGDFLLPLLSFSSHSPLSSPDLRLSANRTTSFLLSLSSLPSFFFLVPSSSQPHIMQRALSSRARASVLSASSGLRPSTSLNLQQRRFAHKVGLPGLG